MRNNEIVANPEISSEILKCRSIYSVDVVFLELGILDHVTFR